MASWPSAAMVPSPDVTPDRPSTFRRAGTRQRPPATLPPSPSGANTPQPSWLVVLERSPDRLLSVQLVSA
jgi:hypothetical protein